MLGEKGRFVGETLLADTLYLPFDVHLLLFGNGHLFLQVLLQFIHGITFGQQGFLHGILFVPAFLLAVEVVIEGINTLSAICTNRLLCLRLHILRIDGI